MTLLLHQSAHLALTVHRSARGELAGLFKRHDCGCDGLDATVMRGSRPGIVGLGVVAARRRVVAGVGLEVVEVLLLLELMGKGRSGIIRNSVAGGGRRLVGQWISGLKITEKLLDAK